MFDHISFGTSDLGRSAAFYDACLSALGIVRVWTQHDAVGYGYPAREDNFAIKLYALAAHPGVGFHVAFTSKTRSQVDLFFRLATAHGGTDDGLPGLRLNYGQHYYAAFVRDPDGHKVEAVCHSPE